jgi:hypothetical protein
LCRHYLSALSRQTIPLSDADFGKEIKLKVTKFNNVNSLHLFLDREGA